MKPIDSKWIAIGPALQWIRGLISRRRSTLPPGVSGRVAGLAEALGLLLGLAILSTAGPAPGSVEGLIYTKVPPLDQLLGLREVVAQTLAFSWLLVAWYQRPHRAWGNTCSMGLAARGRYCIERGRDAVLPRHEGLSC
jgi:hypothetical protein